MEELIIDGAIALGAAIAGLWAANKAYKLCTGRDVLAEIWSRRRSLAWGNMLQRIQQWVARNTQGNLREKLFVVITRVNSGIQRIRVARGSSKEAVERATTVEEVAIDEQELNAVFGTEKENVLVPMEYLLSEGAGVEEEYVLTDDEPGTIPDVLRYIWHEWRSPEWCVTRSAIQQWGQSQAEDALYVAFEEAATGCYLVSAVAWANLGQTLESNHITEAVLDPKEITAIFGTRKNQVAMAPLRYFLSSEASACVTSRKEMHCAPKIVPSVKATLPNGSTSDAITETDLSPEEVAAIFGSSPPASPEHPNSQVGAFPFKDPQGHGFAQASYRSGDLIRIAEGKVSWNAGSFNPWNDKLRAVLRDKHSPQHIVPVVGFSPLREKDGHRLFLAYRVMPLPVRELQYRISGLFSYGRIRSEELIELFPVMQKHEAALIGYMEMKDLL